MAKVKNLTDDTLSWNGVDIGPGGVVDVDDNTALRMVDQHPQKFEVQGVKPEGQPQCPTRRSNN